MSAARPLLATKLSPPRISEAILRPDLLEAAAAASRHKLLLVYAPAGYGKTTLMVEASRLLEWRAGWYKLDVFDHDVTMLIASLTEGIRRHVPEFAETLHARLSNTENPDPPLHELLASFVIALVEDTEGDLFLILDDYHEAADAVDLNRALEYILANLPANVHMVLLTRYEPAFPTRKLSLAGEMTVVDFTALRFSAGQVAALLASRHAPALDARQTRILLETTEGWPASIGMAFDALDLVAIESMSAALTNPRLKHDAYSYLAEQVFARESVETKLFLRETCCLESITVDLANQILGISDSYRHLDHLAKNRVLTFASADRSTFRYHNLFRDFLREQCALEDGADSFRDLQVRTANALDDAGGFEEATELYLLANRPDRALETLARGGEATMDSCRFSTLGSWLDRLPADLARVNPWAHLLEGQIYLREGLYDSALELFAEAEAVFAQVDDKWGMYQTLSSAETALFWKNDTAEAIATCKRALGYARNSSQRVHSLLDLGANLIQNCRWDAANEALTTAETTRGQWSPFEKIRLAGLRAV